MEGLFSHKSTDRHSFAASSLKCQDCQGSVKRNREHAFCAPHNWCIAHFRNQAIYKQHQYSEHHLYRHLQVSKHSISRSHHIATPIDLCLADQARWFSRIDFGTQFSPILIFGLADVTPCKRCWVVIMGQLQLKYHPILTAKEIFAAN